MESSPCGGCFSPSRARKRELMTLAGGASLAFHLATPPGEGGIAVFELYGDSARGLLARLFRTRGDLPPPGGSKLGILTDPAGEEIDEVVVGQVPSRGMWCRLPAWTVAVHGGVWIQSRVAEVLSGAGATRLSRRDVLLRAVNEEALDTIEATAFEYLIEARTERAAAFFSRQHGGELSREILHLLSIVEEARTAPGRSTNGIARLRGLLRGAERAYRLGQPLRVLIAGRPNSGKSTLFNALVGKERVVVAPQVGTTRDLIRETIAIEGWPVEFLDSAGLHSAPADPVEQEAIRRLREEQVDAVIYLVAPPWKLLPEEHEFIDRFPGSRVSRVAAFSDVERPDASAGFALAVSGLRGDGLEELKRSIVLGWLGAREGGSGDTPAPFTLRQRDLLEKALEAWESAAESGALDAVGEALIIVLRSSWSMIQDTSESPEEAG